MNCDICNVIITRDNSLYGEESWKGMIEDGIPFLCQDCGKLCDRCWNKDGKKVFNITYFIMDDDSVLHQDKVPDGAIPKDIYKEVCPECGWDGAEAASLDSGIPY